MEDNPELPGLVAPGSRSGLLHLRLRRTITVGERRRLARAVIHARHFQDYVAHGRQLRDEALSIVGLQRRPVLGIDPKRILVFEMQEPVESENFARAELTVLDESTGKATVAFSDDPQLSAFLSRLDAYMSGEPPDQKTLPYEVFFDSITRVRPYGPDDRITKRLQERLNETKPAERLRLDVECWHPGDTELAKKWLEEVRTATVQAGGEVVDRYVNDSAGLVLARIYLNAEAVTNLAQLDQIARLDGLPDPKVTAADLYGMTLERLPVVEPPVDDAPIVGLVDSGVRSGHPFIGPALLDAVTLLSEFPDGEDQSGHGTRVAGLLLHGPLEAVLRREFVPRPFCRLLSVRVLDKDAQFGRTVLWEKQLDDAIRYCAQRGAKIINLSVGDAGTTYIGPRSTPVAGLIDRLARELQLVIVVSAGNIAPRDYSHIDSQLVSEYPLRLLASSDAALIDPAPAALALTTAGLCSWEAAGGLLSREVATRRPLGEPGWPSPFSRHGPGITGAVKPELAAAAGSFAYEMDGNRISSDHELGCLSCGGRSPDRLFEVDVGTSYASPLVARVAAAAALRYPTIGPNLIRALVLQGLAEPRFASVLTGQSPAKRAEAVRNLVGYGELRLLEAIESSDYRVVLVAEQEVVVDGVHVYEVPIPASFFESGGTRGIVISLAFDPETRARRLDYMSSRMDFQLVRGMSADEVERIFLTMAAEEVEAIEASLEPEEIANETGNTPSPSQLGRRLLALRPPATIRSRGANQLGRLRFGQRLRREDGDSYLLVIRNTNRWASAGSRQRYAVAVSLWRDEDRSPLYDDLQARVEVPIEVEIRV